MVVYLVGSVTAVNQGPLRLYGERLLMVSNVGPGIEARGAHKPAFAARRKGAAYNPKMVELYVNRHKPRVFLFPKLAGCNLGAVQDKIGLAYA